MNIDYIKKWMQGIRRITVKKLNVEVLFAYYLEEKDVSKLLVHHFDVDKKIEESMVGRLKKAFSDKKLKEYDLKEFNLIENNDKTFYECSKKRFSNLEKGIKSLEKDSSKEFLANDLSNTVSAIVKITYDNTTNLLFIGINNFNALKSKRLSSGFIGNVSNHSLSKIDDDNLIFGMGKRIDCVYFSDEEVFIINPEGKSNFEKIFLLDEEYRRKVEKFANELKNYSDTLVNVENLSNDLYGGVNSKKPFVDKMLAKMSEADKKKKLNQILNDKEEFKKRLSDIKQFKKDPKFKEKFNGLKVDENNGTMTYEEENIYPFLAVLADRPKESILLREKELGS
ncbi:hypothetical protein [Liquorilactobacillus satsumensis]|uniref:hypothetical protein n=1 Tax=Liquorilactobacillus satsumensis TaxID=259059 RepID=UPI0021C40365|nr:hypothetical protein [Liquorilactobacillus satsumensis]MCP9327723.1 hypothetical protein [Liquorilactobacillus satsumensis]